MRLGFGPITWNNEDLGTELGPAVSYTTVLDEIAAAGYAGTELGDGFPRSPDVLREALAARGLALPSAWCGLRFFDVPAAEDLAHTRQLCALLAAVGAEFVNLADQGTPERKAFAGRADAAEAPRLTAAQWDALAERVCQAAEVAREHGLEAMFHPHAGTWVETRAELDELLRRVPAPLVKLVWDVGHAVYGGIDPIEVVRAYPERIAYIHLKDVDGTVLEGLRHERLGFDEGIRRRVFTELGRGLLDVPGLLGALADIGYAGWLMIEQDSSWLPPAESARVSRDYLRSLGL
jgi:inosose dehydratase